MDRLGRTQKNLERSRRSTVLPSGFLFGFERFKDAVPPAPDDVPRLTMQLQILERLCLLLFEEGVAEITEIQRDLIEGGGGPSQPAGRAPSQATTEQQGAGILRAGELYAKLHFAIEMRARETEVISLLNRLVNLDMFVVVTSLGFEKDAPDVVASREASGEDVAAPSKLQDYPSRPQRMVSGPEIAKPMKVRIELGVYRFANEEANP
jgi:hypothetical protein